MDDPSCLLLSCDDNDVKRLCPKKCICQLKTTCQACFNDGILNDSTCKCTCKPGFSGTFCGELDGIKACDVNDRPECTELNCQQADVYFRCIRKCQCCNAVKPDSCPTGTILLKADGEGNCTCQCQNSKYDPATGCKNVKPGQCYDEQGCDTQYPKDLCRDNGDYGKFVNLQCPKMCGNCQDTSNNNENNNNDNNNNDNQLPEN